jgi:hypothetical protein
MRTTRKSKRLFAEVDPAEARKVVLDYFNREFLPEDNPARGDDENAAREHMFDKLAELETVVRDLKKKMRHG